MLLLSSKYIETRRKQLMNMATKHIILANDSRLLREILRCVIDKANDLEIVQEVASPEELSSAIELFSPEWVILSWSSNNGGQNWLDTCMTQYPTVRFILLSPGNRNIKVKWQTAYEEDLTNLSLKDFIQILEKDLQHT
jgi:chemotaxis response regulator CheB